MAVGSHNISVTSFTHNSTHLQLLSIYVIPWLLARYQLYYNFAQAPKLRVNPSSDFCVHPPVHTGNVDNNNYNKFLCTIEMKYN